MPLQHLIIDSSHLEASIIPLDVVDLLLTEFAERLIHCRVLHDSIDSVGHSIDIPIISFDGMLQNLSAT